MTTITVPLSVVPRSSRRWLALTMLALAQFLVVLDASIVNIALPSIGSQLHLGTTGLAWVITAYILPFGGLLLLGGKLADRFGHRRLFLIGVAAFIAASALAGSSVSGGMLLASRALQGGSAALLAPSALALLTHLFPIAKDRVKALGIWGAVAGLGSAAGVLLGGVLTADFGWRAVFFVNVPVGLIALITVPLLITRDTRTEADRLDVAGAVTVTGGLVAIVAALTQSQQFGFASPITIGLGALGLALIATFILIERRASNPLVPFAIFRNRSVSAGNVAMLLAGGAMTGLFFSFAVFEQTVLHYTALASGISQLPLAGTLILTAGLAPTVVARLGSRLTLSGGLLVFAVGLVWLSDASSTASFVGALLGPSIVIGIGLGLTFVSGTQLAVSGTGENEAGLASGLVNTSQQIGAALGLAILASVATAHTTALLATGTSAPNALTAGFSWAFIGAAVIATIGAIAVLIIARRTPAISIQS
jgi:EmrB/QacA subfamily drug resistance transporter